MAINVSIPLNFKLEKLLYNSNIPFLPHTCKHLFTNGSVEHTLKKFQIREFFRKKHFHDYEIGKANQYTNVISHITRQTYKLKLLRITDTKFLFYDNTKKPFLSPPPQKQTYRASDLMQI